MSEFSPLSRSSRIFVAGHRGLVGSALVRRLEKDGHLNLILATRDEVDLRDQAAVSRFFARQLPEYVFLAAAKVGGILANSTRPAEFLYDNLAIQTNVIHAAWQNGAQKLVFLGSSCIYPQLASQPIKEEYLLTGPLEPTNEAYAIAKIAGLKLAAAYRKQYGFRAVSLMPTNLYGPGDNFDLETSHVPLTAARATRASEAKAFMERSSNQSRLARRGCHPCHNVAGRNVIPGHSWQAAHKEAIYRRVECLGEETSIRFRTEHESNRLAT